MRSRSTKRFILGLIFIGALIAIRLSGLGEYFTLEQLKLHRDLLVNLVQEQYFAAVFVYLSIFTLGVAFFLPVAMVLTVAGGFLFGVWQGVLYANIGGTIGSIFSFLMVRFLMGERLQEKYADRLVGFNKSMEEQGSLYLLFIHFIFVIPFFMINILAGLTRVPLWTFIWTTSLGILPGQFVYTFTGQQLNEIHSVQDVFSGGVLAALCLLACLGLVPMFIKLPVKIRQR